MRFVQPCGAVIGLKQYQVPASNDISHRRRQCRADASSNLPLVRLWHRVHTEVSRYLGSTRNGVTDLGCGLEVVCNEAVLYRRRVPGVYNCVIFYGDLFRRLAINKPLHVCIFVAVDERGEDVMSDEICHGCNGKQSRRRDGRNVQLLDWVMNKLKGNILLLLPGSPK